jgi:hypothetical protein
VTVSFKDLCEVIDQVKASGLVNPDEPVVVEYACLESGYDRECEGEICGVTLHLNTADRKTQFVIRVKEN